MRGVLKARSEEDYKRRFWGKVEKTSTCWLWTAGKYNTGYGQFWIHGRDHPAHRLAYIWEKGDIPLGLQLDHLCRVRHCVNPAHLEAVTQKENILRGEGFAAKGARQTHCLRGHPFSGANLYTTPAGGRRCLACKSIHWARFITKSAK